MNRRKNWPENLYCAVFELEEYPDMPDDVSETLTYLLGTLKPKEQIVLEMRFIEGMTLAAIGRMIGVTRSRAGQVLAKSLRKLRHHSRREYMENGISMMPDEIPSTIEESKLNLDEYQHQSIDILPLTMRTYNILRRTGLVTIGAILEKSPEELRALRGMGKHGSAEVRRSLDLLAETLEKMRQ